MSLGTLGIKCYGVMDSALEEVRTKDLSNQFQSILITNKQLIIEGTISTRCSYESQSSSMLMKKRIRSVL